jgi:AcrR family transcriptional regulator
VSVQPVELAASRAARREELLDAADRIVQRDGPAAAMSAIAAEAGITKPVLYRHFGDKGGLYAALADRYTERLLVDLRAALARGRTRQARVERAIDAYLTAIEQQPQVYRFLVHSDEAAPAQSQVRSFTRRLAALLADGIAAETGAPALRAQVWAHGIVGMVQAAGDWWLDAAAPRDGPERPCPRRRLVSELSALLSGAYGWDADRA